jgi:hypothetical protein
MELVLELDQAKLMLNQGAIQRTKYEEMIEELHEKLNQVETVNSYSGITNHAL